MSAVSQRHPLNSSGHVPIATRLGSTSRSAPWPWDQLFHRTCDTPVPAGRGDAGRRISHMKLAWHLHLRWTPLSRPGRAVTLGLRRASVERTRGENGGERHTPGCSGDARRVGRVAAASHDPGPCPRGSQHGPAGHCGGRPAGRSCSGGGSPPGFATSNGLSRAGHLSPFANTSGSSVTTTGRADPQEKRP